MLPPTCSSSIVQAERVNKDLNRSPKASVDALFAQAWLAALKGLFKLALEHVNEDLNRSLKVSMTFLFAHAWLAALEDREEAN